MRELKELKDNSLTGSTRLHTADKPLVLAHRAEARRAVPAYYCIVVRALDVVGSLFAIVLLAPVMLAIAVAVKLDSPGPILFRQVRIGINRRRRRGTPQGPERRRQGVFGRPFVLYKFRSMYADARERFPEMYAYQHSEEERRTLPIKILVGRKCDPKELEKGPDLDGRLLLGDPRVTRLGRWLRKTSFDELPNFFNVLKGDMHLVGPRPDIAENIRYYSKPHMRKLDVKPGITGMAQVNGRGKLSFEQTNDYDVDYVDNRSVALDLKILFRTLVVCLRRDGAF
jgi:lipopolysaccharide/colanic/teichoic acid biosynthesis glycosyltransferase